MSFTKGMATLTSTSTDAQVEAAYDNNADYDVPPDTSKAESFIQACRILLRRRVPTYSIDGHAVTRESIQKSLDDAMAWYKTRARGRSSFCGTRFADPAVAVGGSRDCLLD
jgi:hypothetical protein